MPRRKLRVLFALAEAEPFIKTGGLGDVGGALPQAIKAMGCEVRVMLPKYQSIPDEYTALMKPVASFNVNLGWRNQYCGIEKLVLNNIIYYFIDNEYYFKRANPYGYFDDGERFAYYAKAIVESLAYLDDFKCDILHCHDWHTALAPVFLRELYRSIPLYDNVKTVFTVHNMKFQGAYPKVILGDILGLHLIPNAVTQLSFIHDNINYMKGALNYSDILTTVSPTYAQEIKTTTFGEQLNDVFDRRENVLHGIINGIDTKLYDPETDIHILDHFSVSDMKGKTKAHQALQKEMGLEVQDDIPIAIVISRLTEQKGMELFKRVMGELLELPMQFIVLGTGDQEYEDMFRYWAERYPTKMVTCITFNHALSHRLYAGADLLLMPSLFEPCGLSQMIAMRYGTLPIVRETGGLKDSVTPYNRYTNDGNGFSFANYNAHEFLFTVTDAVKLYHEEKDTWLHLVQNAMKTDVSWNRPASDYIKLYQSLHPEVYGYLK